MHGHALALQGFACGSQEYLGHDVTDVVQVRARDPAAHDLEELLVVVGGLDGELPVQPGERGQDQDGVTMLGAVHTDATDVLLVVHADAGGTTDGGNLGDEDSVTTDGSSLGRHEIGDGSTHPVARGQLAQDGLIAGEDQMTVLADQCTDSIDVGQHAPSLLPAR